MKSQEINIFGLRVRHIQGFDGKYGISSEGDVINLHGEYLLKGHLCLSGQEMVPHRLPCSSGIRP